MMKIFIFRFKPQGDGVLIVFAKDETQAIEFANKEHNGTGKTMWGLQGEIDIEKLKGATEPQKIIDYFTWD